MGGRETTGGGFFDFFRRSSWPDQEPRDADVSLIASPTEAWLCIVRAVLFVVLFAALAVLWLVDANRNGSGAWFLPWFAASGLFAAASWRFVTLRARRSSVFPSMPEHFFHFLPLTDRTRPIASIRAAFEFLRAERRGSSRHVGPKTDAPPPGAKW